jgi:glutamate 5-kinase
MVSVADENEKEIARGLVNFNSEELSGILGKKGVNEAIHRDNLVIL